MGFAKSVIAWGRKAEENIELNKDPDYEVLYQIARLRLGYIVFTFNTFNINSRKDLAETRSLVEEIMDGVKSSEGK